MLNRRTILCLTILLASAIVAARSIGTAAPPAEQKAPTFLEHLKEGQPVSLSEKDGRFEIGIFPPDYQLLVYKIVEVGPDFVTLRIANISDTIIPVYSIKAIRVLRAVAR